MKYFHLTSSTHTHPYASTEIFQICTGSAFCLSQKMLSVWMLHRQNAEEKKSGEQKRNVFLFSLLCAHTAQTLSEELGQIMADMKKRSEWEPNKQRWHMEWCARAAYHIHLPKLKFHNDDKYLNGSSYRLCAANNHSESIMTVIKTAHKHQFHHERSCVRAPICIARAS